MNRRLPRRGIRARIITQSGQTKFEMVALHPIETGDRINRKTGKKIPADFIQKLTISIDGEESMEMRLTKKISKNPYFGFDLVNPIYNGQQINISWIDNHGIHASHVAMVIISDKGSFDFTRY